MYLKCLSLGTLLVPAAPCSVIHATRHRIYLRLEMDDIVFASTLIWYHTYRQTHTEQKGDNKLTQTYKYILTPPVMKTQ